MDGDRAVSQDDTPWRQTERQREADDLLEEWAGEPAAPSTSAYPAEWTMPPPEPTGRKRSRRRRRDRRAEGYAGTVADAVVVREVRRPRQEFPLPDQAGRIALPGDRSPREPAPRRLIDPAASRSAGRPADLVTPGSRPGRRADDLVVPGRAGTDLPGSRGSRPGARTPSGTGPAPSATTGRARTRRGGRAAGTRAARTRGSWIGGLITAAVIVGVGVVSAVSGGSGGDSSDDIAGMGSELAPYGLPIELTDLGVVDADTVFTFQGDPDRWDSSVEGWRTPGDLIRVYLDADLTVPAPDAWVGRSYDDDTGSTIEVSPSYDTVLSVSGSDDSADIALGERWGAAPEYYLVQLADLTTGEPLDTLPVQRFTVEDYRPRPEVTAEVDDDGVLRLSWDRVDGAVRYDVLDPAYGFGSLGESPDLTWTSDLEDTPDGYRQNTSLSYLSGVSDDALHASPDVDGTREIGGLAVSALLQGGRISVVPVDSALLARVPLRQASTAWDHEGLYSSMAPGDLPGALPYEMADGSTALLPVTYRTDTIAEIYSGTYAVRYTVHGARPSDTDPLRVEAADLAEARRLVEDRVTELDAQRDPAGGPTPYTY